jgi:hypothetical protein
LAEAAQPTRPDARNNDVVALARERKLTVCDAAYLDSDLERAAIAEGVALFGA